MLVPVRLHDCRFIQTTNNLLLRLLLDIPNANEPLVFLQRLGTGLLHCNCGKSSCRCRTSSRVNNCMDETEEWLWPNKH